MKKYIVLLSSILLLIATTVRADEGMWLLPSASPTVGTHLGKLGFMRVHDLSRPDGGPSLQKAVVKLSTGCTGSVISRSGLVLTNYHCVNNALQQHSNANHDLFARGFYAETLADELPIKGMAVAITTDMLDVTKSIRNGIAPDTPLSEAQAQIEKNKAKILDTISRQNGVEAHIVQQFSGNRYVLIIQKVYRDVRLVLIPPTNIGKFGGDTDNWTYPSHTGDFALLRIYSNNSNEPADYTPQNQPYNATSKLTISQDGYQEGDLTVVMGYPATTQRYATTEEIKYNRDCVQKAYIDVWQRLLPLWDSLASNNPDYAAAIVSNRESAANYLKYYQMQSRAIDEHSLITQRDNASTNFCAWYTTTPERNKKYFGTIADINESLSAASEPQYQVILLNEALRWGMPLTRLAAQFSELANALEAKDKTATEAFKTRMNDTYLSALYSQLDLKNDQLSTAASLSLCMEKLPVKEQPDVLQNLNGKQALDEFLGKTYAGSLFTSKDRVIEFLDSPSLKKLKKDPIYQLATSFQERIDALQKELAAPAKRLGNARQRYFEGLLEQHADSALYPDADGTLRLSYGHVKSLSPSDGVHLNYFTTVAGMAQKARTGKPDFRMNSDLHMLQKNNAFSGFQNENGQMPLNFITTNDITGGNSGSPVVNNEGALIGLAFDCNSEGVIGQYMFDNENARSICVDIRFVLLYIKMQKNMRVFNELSIFGKRPLK